MALLLLNIKSSTLSFLIHHLGMKTLVSIIVVTLLVTYFPCFGSHCCNPKNNYCQDTAHHTHKFTSNNTHYQLCLAIRHVAPSCSNFIITCNLTKVSSTHQTRSISFTKHLPLNDFAFENSSLEKVTQYYTRNEPHRLSKPLPLKITKV